jgi:ABC-type bacteriocin/lantibiotic exporter with double-glycine peptidase domain
VKNDGIELTVHENNSTNDTGSEKYTKRNSILFSNVTAKWTRAQTSNSLDNINLTVEPGQLVVVVGPVGSGKVCKINQKCFKYV